MFVFITSVKVRWLALMKRTSIRTAPPDRFLTVYSEQAFSGGQKWADVENFSQDTVSRDLARARIAAVGEKFNINMGEGDPNFTAFWTG